MNIHRFRLSYLEGCKAQNHQKDRDDIEPGDNFWLGPAKQFKMMMQGGHFENPPAFAVFLLRVFEIHSLNNDRHGFHKEYTAECRGPKFLLHVHAPDADL